MPVDTMALAPSLTDVRAPIPMIGAPSELEDPAETGYGSREPSSDAAEVSLTGEVAAIQTAIATFTPPSYAVADEIAPPRY